MGYAPILIAYFAQASDRSPMRRGLKFEQGRHIDSFGFRFRPIPDEEGTEMDERADDHPGHARASDRSPMRRGLKCASYPIRAIKPTMLQTDPR